MSWFKRILPKIVTSEKKKGVPEGVWSKCNSCSAILYRAELERHLFVCPKCQYHMRLTARQRIDFFLDAENRIELGQKILPEDRLKFRDSKKYKDRITSAQKNSGESEAICILQGALKGLPIVVAVFEFSFIGGSMSRAVGERFVLGVETAIQHQAPFVCFAASGGARMQEGLFSLFQMAKTATALTQLSKAKLPYISVLTDPTMGGVSASLATLGDLIVAEPKALMGFAGPRVIEQTIRQTLPEGFQRSEFLLQHGAIDQIIDRRDMRNTLHRILTNLTSSSHASNV